MLQYKCWYCCWWTYSCGGNHCCSDCCHYHSNLLVVDEVDLATIIIQKVAETCNFVKIEYFNVLNRRRRLCKNDLAVSTNMAYGQVKPKALGDVGEEYDNADGLASSGQDRESYELSASKPEAPVYATADDTTQ